MNSGLLTNVDYAVIAVYLLGMIGLGFWISRRQKTAEDYFLAGRRMGWFILSISIWISICSANSMQGILCRYILVLAALSIPGTRLESRRQGSGGGWREVGA